MNLTLTLQRLDPFGDGLPGDLFIDGAHECVTLENAALAIPAGRYPVVLTVSGRAQRRELWCPAQETHPDDKAKWVLPVLLDVPGRDAIRIHALNRAAQSEGCIGTGSTRDGMEVSGSRTALIRVMAKLRAALDAGDAVTLDVVDAI